MEKVIVTRHLALLDYLEEKGVISSKDRADVVAHATLKDVRNKQVIGVLPNFLACEAGSLTEIPLKLTPEDRGKELSLERIREVAGDPVTYIVIKVPEDSTLSLMGRDTK